MYSVISKYSGEKSSIEMTKPNLYNWLKHIDPNFTKSLEEFDPVEHGYPISKIEFTRQPTSSIRRT